MSRIGNNPISIPEGVSIDIQESLIVVKGKLGELTQSFSDVKFEINDGFLTVLNPLKTKESNAKHGLYRALVFNMIEGVTKGFTKELELVGVGYRASNQSQTLDLALGYSHNIIFDIAPEVKVETISEKGKNPIIKLTSFDKQQLALLLLKLDHLENQNPIKVKVLGLLENK